MNHLSILSFIYLLSAVAMLESEQMKAFDLAGDEDTEVHMWLHNLLAEIFHDEGLIKLWANGESISSKNHRQQYSKKAIGKKADFRVLSSADREEIFAEFKRSSHSSSSAAVLQDFFKIAIFLQGAINGRTADENPQCWGLHLRSTSYLLLESGTLEAHITFTGHRGHARNLPNVIGA